MEIIVRSRIGRQIIDKMSIISNLVYRYKTIPIKIPASWAFLGGKGKEVGIDKLILKFIKQRYNQKNSKKNKVGRLDFTIY